MIGPIITPMPQIAIALAALVQRVGVEHHRLRQRHQRRAEHALQQAEQHHLVDVLRQRRTARRRW